MNGNDKDFVLAALLACAKFLLPALIVIIGIFVSIFEEKTDPIDTCSGANREIVAHVEVMDSNYRGFRVVYVTTKAVCLDRLEEIKSRKNIKDGFQQIRAELPLIFNNDMFYTDIYDFAEEVVKYEIDPCIEIHNIFVEGKEKQNLYAQFNPNLPNCATWIDPNTEQGILYIKAHDVYKNRKKEDRIYRYWKANVNYEFSKTDEQFSHFTNDRRIR